MSVYICRKCKASQTRQPFKRSEVKYWTCMKCAGIDKFQVTVVEKTQVTVKRAKMKLF